MGQRVKKSKIDVQRALLKDIFVSMLTTNIEIMRFQITLTKDKDDIKGLKKFIRDSQKAIEIVNGVVHYEILVSLYNTFLNGKETYFVSLSKTISNKATIRKWDKSERGFKLFLELENQAKAKTQEEYNKKVAQQEMIRRAKEEGKKVEMVYVDGKLQPRIVEEKIN